MVVDINKHKLKRTGRTEAHIKTYTRRGKRDLEDKHSEIEGLRIELAKLTAGSNSSNSTGGGAAVGGKDEIGGNLTCKALFKELKDSKHEVAELESQLLDETVSKSKLLSLVELERKKLDKVDLTKLTLSDEANLQLGPLNLAYATVSHELDQLERIIADMLEQSKNLEKQSQDASKNHDRLAIIKNSGIIKALTDQIEASKIESGGTEAEQADKLEAAYLKRDLIKVDVKTVKDLVEQLESQLKAHRLKVKEVVADAKNKGFSKGFGPVAKKQSLRDEIIVLNNSIKQAKSDYAPLKAQLLTQENKKVQLLKVVAERDSRLYNLVRRQEEIRLLLLEARKRFDILKIESNTSSKELQELMKSNDAFIANEQSNRDEIEYERIESENKLTFYKSEEVRYKKRLEEESQEKFRLVDSDYKLDAKFLKLQAIKANSTRRAALELSKEKEVEIERIRVEKVEEKERLESKKGEEVERVRPVQVGEAMKEQSELERRIQEVEIRIDSTRSRKGIREVAISNNKTILVSTPVISIPVQSNYSSNPSSTTTVSNPLTSQVVHQLIHAAGELNELLKELRNENLEYLLRISGIEC